MDRDEDLLVLETPEKRAAPELIEDPNEFDRAVEWPTAYVTLPTRRKRVKVKAIRSEERASIEKQLQVVKRDGSSETNMALFREMLIIYGTIREDGGQMFGREHLAMLRRQPAGDIVAWGDAIIKVSGIGKQDIEEMTSKSESSGSDS